MEEFPGRVEGVSRRHLLGAVHGQVTKVLDEPSLGEKRFTHRLPEGGFVDQGAEVILIRQAQRVVMFVEPCHRQFQGAAGVETGGSGIGLRQFFRLLRGLEEEGPFGGIEEGEVAHGATNESSNTFKASCNGSRSEWMDFQIVS